MKKFLIIALTVVAVLLVFVPAVGTHILMQGAFKVEDPSATFVDSAWVYSRLRADYPREEVTFPSGENTLHGFVYGARNDSALVVLVHGIGASHESYLAHIVWFVNHGYRVFAPDLTASGRSSGNDRKGLQQSALDVHAALTYIEKDPSLSRLQKVLYGHSWGAFGVSGSLAFDHDVKAVASMAAYAYPRQQLTDVVGYMFGPLKWLVRPWMGLEDRIKFGKNASINAIDAINRRPVPVLAVHGTADEMIRYETASIIAYRDRITNPNVTLLTMDKPGRNGHESIFHAAGDPMLDEELMNTVNVFFRENLKDNE